VLYGRQREVRALDALIEAVSAGRSAVLVVRGQPGVGKTALLEHLVGQASFGRVARAAGVQSEMELAFAGLHQLCAPMLERLADLPAPQREALRTAFGLSGGDAPDRLLVGLAVLNLLSEVATEQPLICVVDDVQWLDRASAQALTFVARRLQAESVALVFAVREPNAEPGLIGLPELVVEGLRDDDARALLASAIRGPLDEHVRERIIAETRGNPLALLELPRGLTPAGLAGGFGAPHLLPLSGRIEESFQRRVAQLPPATQMLLLVAAAEPVGDRAVVWGAAEQLAIPLAAAAPAATAGLGEFGARVRFGHPLVRSAVYRAASPQERQRVHRALAAATDPEAAPDRRAWHRAQAAAGPDEEVAEELERSAGRAQARGGLAAAAAFLGTAVELTLQPALRVRRALDAAAAMHQAGAPDTASTLLMTAEAGPLDELQQARIEVLRAQIAFAQHRGGDAPPLLLKAAKRLEELDVSSARDTYLEALAAAMFVGRPTGGVGVAEVAQAARTAPPPAGTPRPADLLLDALAVRLTEGQTAATPRLRQALDAFRTSSGRGEQETWLWLASRTCMDLWDHESWDLISARGLRLAREAGALSALPQALSSRVGVQLHAGDLHGVASLLEEAEAVTQATGSDVVAYIALALAAWQGREAEAAQVEAGAAELELRDDGVGLTVMHWARAVLYNGLGRYEDAMVAASRASEYPDQQLGVSAWGLVELVEAASRGHRPEEAAAAFSRLAERTTNSGSDWALGAEARSRALLVDDDIAEPLYLEAIERLGRTAATVYRARAHLVYGEWLRRVRRRLDAREQLRIAHDMFTTMGLPAFAERSAREMKVTGETARKRRNDTREELTPQEGQIARLAADGLSNPQIAARLFISPRTVEYHLHKVFVKLGVNSRGALAVMR
jgi:DNA-binding CsgD family transcriptional regulator